MIALNKPLRPNITKLTTYLESVNESGWYTNFGPLHELLTKRLEAYLGVKHLLLVANGTLAIQVACKTLNINSAITTPFSFVATTSALLWQGVNTAYSDINPQTYNLCPTALSNALAQDNSYDAVVATHICGNPCDVHEIQSVAEQYNKKIIYDAAHTFGVKLNGESILNFGDASTLSFHATKVFHTVEGGAVVFKNKADYEKAKQLINFGIKDGGELGEPGINAKLNEYQCAVGLTLLDDIEQVIKHRTALFNLYYSELKGVVKLQQWHSEASLNGIYVLIYIADEYLQHTIITALATENIQSRRYFTPSLDIAYSEQKNFGCNVSHTLTKGVICLPLHAYMTTEDVFQVTNLIKKTIKLTAVSS